MVHIDGAFYRVSDSAFELTIPRWEDHEPESLEEADATIELPDGTRYAATFMTLRTIATVMDRWQTTSECLNGEYFWISDLVVIRQPGIPAIVDAVRHLIATDELTNACGLLEPETSDL